MQDRSEFFLVALPGLEDLVVAEVKRWFPNLEVESEFGGVTVWAPRSTGFAMNLVLKTPTRILLRVARWRIRDFPKLFHKISEFEWRDWLDPECELEVQAATVRSRLKIKKRIEETAIKAWRAHRESVKALKASQKRATLYVRFKDDECTLSLDTSGDRLHRRGQRTFVGEAPLRETIAAALLELMAKHQPQAKRVELVDPMMGSGTFLLEAGWRDQNVETRGFAFEYLVGGDQVVAPAVPADTLQFESLVGFERDSKTLKAAQMNLSSLKSSKVSLLSEDLWSARALPPVNAPLERWVVANPPYGERLKVSEPLGEYYARLFKVVNEVCAPSLACFLLSAKASGRLALPLNWKVLEKRRFSNGGIPVVAFVFKT